MMRIRPAVAALAAAALLALAVPLALAVSTGGSRGDKKSTQEKSVDEADQLYQDGLALAEEGKFVDALERFERANRKRHDDPEILNMLAYCQRKTGDLDAAFENYGKALKIRPKFPQAREYLGEAHLQAALRQLEILRSYGHEGETESVILATALRRAAAELDGVVPIPDKVEKTGGRW